MNLNEYIQTHEWDILLAVVCAVLGIAGGLVGIWWSNRHTRKIAQESGSFNKPKLELFIFSQPIKPKEIWCFLLPGNEDDCCLIKISLAIINSGTLQCDNPSLTIETLKEILVPNEGIAREPFPAVLEDHFKRALGNTHNFNPEAFPITREAGKIPSITKDSDEAFAHVSHSLPSISPKAAGVIEEAFILRPTVNLNMRTI